MSNRQDIINDINRMREAIKKTESPMLIRDYSKGIRRKQKELRTYDRYMREWQRKTN